MCIFKFICFSYSDLVLNLNTAIMYSAAAISKIKLAQLGFSYIALMQFTAYMWPKQAVVKDGYCYDFIIVGAGTAGSVIANRLTENDEIDVLLIEAGGDPPMESTVPGQIIFLRESRYDWNYTGDYDQQVAKCHQKPFSEISSGKMLGGTSSLNYMIYSRGHPSDYNSWANMTSDSTWEWDNVFPYFIKSENIKEPTILNSPDKARHGIHGYVGISKDGRSYVKDILKSFESLGRKLRNDPVDGLGYSQTLLNIDGKERASSASSYLSPAKERTNLHVLKNSLVTKINFDDQNNAVGVNIINEEGKTITVNAKKEVIVSAGAFNSPKLLMLSGIGPREQLTCKKIDVISDLPVGKNLQDHIAVVISHAMEKKEKPRINPTRYPAAPLVGYSALDKCQKYPDYESLSYSAHPNVFLEYCSFAYRLNHEICDNTYEQIVGKIGLFNEIIHLQPKSRGEVKLRSSNPMDPPLISTKYLSNEDDLNKLVEYVKHFTPIVNTTHFRNIGAKFVDASLEKCSNYETGSEEYWKCYASCLFTGKNNFIGTCAMGSVVDSKLKVLGVQRLRVVDASIMPTITRGNTNGPVTMIAEKAADFIKKEYAC